MAVIGFEAVEMCLMRGSERQNGYVCVPVYVVSVLCVQSEVILLACVALL